MGPCSTAASEPTVGYVVFICGLLNMSMPRMLELQKNHTLWNTLSDQLLNLPTQILIKRLETTLQNPRDSVDDATLFTADSVISDTENN